jgi:cytosine/adenosine deaminase-related metal-dependent hydrolase
VLYRQAILAIPPLDRWESKYVMSVGRRPADVTEPATVDLLVAGGVVVTVDAARRVLPDGAVAVRDGRIVEVGPTADLRARYRATRTIDATDFVTMPGLVDAHTHVSVEHLARSLPPDAAGHRWMMEWAAPLYAAVTPEEERVAALLACHDLIRNGTTTFGEGNTIRDIAAVAGAVEQAGLRAVLGVWTWDRPAEPRALRQTVDQALARNADAIARYHRTAGGRITVATSCVHPVLCTTELLKGLRALASEKGVGLAYHHASSRQPVDQYVATHGRRPLLDFSDLGILGPDVRTVHMVHLDAAELDVLVRSGASVAHCPQTGLRLAYGITAVGCFPEMIARGVRVGVGTDGVMCADSVDLFKAIKLAAGLFKDAREDPTLIPAEKAIDLGTIDAARVLGLEREVGSLEAGKSADLILLDRRTPELTPLLNVTNALVYGVDGRCVDTVIASGRILMEGRRVLTVDVERLYTEARLLAPQLIARAAVRPKF